MPGFDALRRFFAKRKEVTDEESTRPDRLGRPFLVAPLALTYVVYRPVTGAYFHADDWWNLQRIANGPVLRYVLQPFAGHVFILRNALFYLSYQAFGMTAPPWFWTVLLTHLLNVLLLFSIVRLLCGARLACLAATLWGTTPIQEGTLAWYSIYGQVVAATFVLAVLLDMARCHHAGRRVSTGRAFAWCALLLAASTCFGIAIGVAFGFPVIVWLVFGNNGVTRWGWALLLLLPFVVGAGYIAAQRLYATIYGDPTVEVMGLLAQLRWGSVTRMCAYLFGAGVSGLIVGLVSPLGPGVGAVFQVSPLARDPNPLMIGVVGAYAAGVLAALLVGSPDSRRWLVGMVILAACGYAIIAAGRATFYTEIQMQGYGGAELRYHYLVTAALAIGLALVLNEIASLLPALPRLKTALLAATLGALMLGWRYGEWHIDQHTWSRNVALRTVAEIRSALAAAPAGMPVYIPNRAFGSSMLPRTSFAGTAAVYVMYFPDDGRPVYFIEQDPEVRTSVPPGTRLARILIPQEAAPKEVARPRT